MGKFDGVLIVSDIDGTLTNSNQELSAENRKAIEYFKSEGGIFTIATGRLSDYFREKEFEKLINCPAIMLNGAAIYDFKTDEFIYSKKFQDDFLEIYKEILAFKKFNKIDFCFINKTRNSQDIDVGNCKDLCKIVTVVEDEQTALDLCEILEDKFSKTHEVFRTWSTGVEVLPKGATKGNCVEFLRKHLKNIKTVAGIGDFENDISLLEKSDVSFAPQNAIEELKQKADYIVSHHNNNAIKDVVDILKQKTPSF